MDVNYKKQWLRSDRMKRIMIVLGILFFLAGWAPPSSSHAQKGEMQDLNREAERVGRGERSPGELEKWEKRLESARSWEQKQKIILCLNVIGIIYYHDGNLEKALKYLNESLQLSRGQKDGGSPVRTMSSTLMWLAQTQKAMGLQEEALKNAEECLKVAKALDQQGSIGKGLLLIGSILLDRGRAQEAMTYFEQAVPLAESRKDNMLLTLCLGNMARVYTNQGDYERARLCYTRNLKISEEAKHKKGMIHALNGLGETSRLQKDYDAALEYFTRAAALSEEIGFKLGISNGYRKIGRIYLSQKKTQKALGYLQKTYEMDWAMGAKPSLALTSKIMGMAYGHMKDWDEAIRKTDDAIGLLKQVDIPDELQQCYHMKGQYLEKKGDMAGAEAHYRESVRVLEALREGVAGGEEEKVSFGEMRGQVYQNLIDILLRQGKVAEAMAYLERSRMKHLRDQFDQLKPTLNNKEEEKAKEKEEKLREEMEEVRVILTQEQSKPREEQDTRKIEELEKALNVKKQDYIEFVNDLRDRFPDLASLLAIQPDSLLDLQALLPPQAAIVQYLILSDRLYIFVVSKDTLSHKEITVTQEDLEGKIDYMRSLLMNPQIPMNMGPVDVETLRPKDPTRANLFEMFINPFFKISEELHQILIGPVKAEIAPFTVLGIIPNGKLHLLPFQAMGERTSTGGFRFLMDEKALFQLNSQSILKFAQKQAHEIGDKGRLIAFGNPDNSLKYAEEEVRMIKGLFPKTATYLQQEASEDRVKTGLEGYDILHLATHGKMKGQIKESYILMAGSPDGKEDGKLYLREIWGLALKGYQLVTLSACETAMGKGASGDIMVSLETAFLRAGTPTIMASLWGVDDQATGVLMKVFYENLTTRGKADALRTAQTALRNDPRFAFPYYWAPFILVGDWR